MGRTLVFHPHMPSPAPRRGGYGAKVALIERGAQWDAAKRKRLSAGPGGTCVNVGCVPSLGSKEGMVVFSPNQL
jgi:hypothetical protein